jgi:hypothetical protein
MYFRPLVIYVYAYIYSDTHLYNAHMFVGLDLQASNQIRLEGSGGGREGGCHALVEGGSTTSSRYNIVVVLVVFLFIGTQERLVPLDSALLDWLRPIVSRRDGLNLSAQCDLSTFLSTKQ